MSQTSNKDQILARIKKLLNHAKSARQMGSLQEAEAFAEKANELIIEYNLSIAEVDGVDLENKFDTWKFSESVNYGDNQSGSRWKYLLMAVLCEHNLCSFTFRQKQKTMKVYGMMENVDVVVWLYNYLSVGLLRLAQSSYNLISNKPNRYSYLKDFLIGAVAGLNRKFEDQKKKFKEIASFGTLMVVNQKALNEFVKKEVPEIKDGSGIKKTINVDYNAYSEGFVAGKNYNINKPLSNSNSTSTTKSLIN